MMHQEVDVQAKINHWAVLSALADHFHGMLTLRSYSRSTLICDTMAGRLLGYGCAGPYDKVGTLWVVQSKSKTIGMGHSPQEAIEDAQRKVAQST